MNSGYIIAAYAISFSGLALLIAASFYRYYNLKKQLKAFQR